MNKFESFLTEKKSGYINSFIAVCILSSSYMHMKHFESKSYDDHKAYEVFYTEMPELIDKFTETYIGLGNTYTSADVKTPVTLDMVIQLGQSVYDALCPTLQSIADEIIALTAKTKYLLSLT